MVAAIDSDNTASITFHGRMGFTTVARMPEVGYKFGRWLDLVLMQQRALAGSQRVALQEGDDERRDIRRWLVPPGIDVRVELEAVASVFDAEIALLRGFGGVDAEFVLDERNAARLVRERNDRVGAPHGHEHRSASGRRPGGARSVATRGSPLPRSRRRAG